MRQKNCFSLKITRRNSLFASLEVCYIQEERSTAHISLNSLLGEYSGGSECSGPRCFQPCHLQYNVTSGAEWKILEATNNTALEELYCDGSIGGLFKLNSAQVIER